MTPNLSQESKDVHSSGLRKAVVIKSRCQEAKATERDLPLEHHLIFFPWSKSVTIARSKPATKLLLQSSTMRWPSSSWWDSPNRWNQSSAATKCRWFTESFWDVNNHWHANPCKVCPWSSRKCSTMAMQHAGVRLQGYDLSEPIKG